MLGTCTDMMKCESTDLLISSDVYFMAFKEINLDIDANICQKCP